MTLTAFVCTLLLALPAEIAPDAPAADTMRSRAPVVVKPLFFPASLWSGTQGFGIGGGLSVQNLGWEGSRLRLAARPAQYRGIYDATLQTGDPYTTRRYAELTARYLTTGRSWYFGVGPNTSSDDQIAVELSQLQLGARGHVALGEHLRAGPTLGWMRVDGRGFEEEEAGALEGLDPRSRAALTLATTGTDVVDAVSYGVELAYDRLDAPQLPRRGLLVQLTARRTAGALPLALDGREADLRFDQFTGGINGFLPLPGRSGRLAGRLLVARTVNREETAVPYYFLPSFGSPMLPGYRYQRFHGPDLLSVHLEYRRAVADAMGFFGIEGILFAGAASVYDDLFEDFELALSFDDEVASGAPLRPAGGFGLSLFNPGSRTSMLTAVVGFSPEGFVARSFRLVLDLRRPFTPFHGSM